ncbi:hypothetical protein GCM10023185_14670 [Hymenobacter saemangeumensis]|uniref:DUF3606 domain-containing protein n=1 Tax=Hymenobacter saemangeumensis TaxID=1084522 RepID=A0ABP8I916_9BACT
MKTGHKTQVTSGVHEGQQAEIKEPHPDFTGFYRCYIGQSAADIEAQKENKAPENVALLHENQLLQSAE